MRIRTDIRYNDKPSPVERWEQQVYCNISDLWDDREYMLVTDHFELCATNAASMIEDGVMEDLYEHTP